MSAACPTFAALRTAWVDGRLSAADTDRLMRHLAVCPDCVRDVREQRRVADLLGVTPADAPSDALAARLVRIAGLEARQPLWSRPFRRTRAGALPTPRRRRRRRAGTAVVASATLAGAVGVLGYAVGPASALTPVGDPGAASRSEFSATIAQLPLGNDAVATVLTSDTAALRSEQTPQPVPVPGSGRTFDESGAVRELERAGVAAGSVSYHGRQRVQIAQPGGTLDARVELSSSSDDTATVVVRTASGRQVGQGRLKVPASVRGGSSPVIDLVAQAYALSGRGATLLGRRAAVIDARAADGTLAARWWVDRDTGLLLRQETYDAGQLQQAVGFSSLSLGSSASVGGAAPEVATTQTTASMLMSSASSLASDGWTCAAHLNGMAMVGLRTDSTTDPDLVHTVYSDGLHTVSVFERKGELTSAPAGTRWDRSRNAYVSTGLPASASWQSGGTVFTVVTDGDVGLLRGVIGSLPHDRAPHATTLARIAAGWSRLLHLG